MYSQARSNYLNSGDPSLQIPDDVPEEFDDSHHHYALAFQFYEQAYALWLDGDDTFAEPRQELEERYGLCFIDKITRNLLTMTSQEERKGSGRIGTTAGTIGPCQGRI